jgi:hypothetical protein
MMENESIDWTIGKWSELIHPLKRYELLTNRQHSAMLEVVEDNEAFIGLSTSSSFVETNRYYRKEAFLWLIDHPEFVLCTEVLVRLGSIFDKALVRFRSGLDLSTNQCFLKRFRRYCEWVDQIEVLSSCAYEPMKKVEITPTEKHYLLAHYQEAAVCRESRITHDKACLEISNSIDPNTYKKVRKSVKDKGLLDDGFLTMLGMERCEHWVLVNRLESIEKQLGIPFNSLRSVAKKTGYQ